MCGIATIEIVAVPDSILDAEIYDALQDEAMKLVPTQQVREWRNFILDNDWEPNKDWEKITSELADQVGATEFNGYKKGDLTCQPMKRSIDAIWNWHGRLHSGMVALLKKNGTPLKVEVEAKTSLDDCPRPFDALVKVKYTWRSAVKLA